MSEWSVISKTLRPNTIETIYQDLLQLGIRHGDTVLLHSSLSAIGWVCGGAQAVIMALREATGEEGTLVMPAHSGDWSDPAQWENPPVPADWVQTIYETMPAFDPAITPTRGMGSIAELFRTHPGTIRSNHPQVSFCASGRLAHEIVDNHPLSPQFCMDSPLGKLYTLHAKVLLLGVGYDSCTSFHLAETLIDQMPMIRLGTAVFEQGERVWKWFEDYDYSTDDFGVLGTHFEENRRVSRGKIGNADCRLFEVKDAVDFAKAWLLRHRFGTT
jgi:aminoglycoside 3-N-acetyltransferase